MTGGGRDLLEDWDGLGDEHRRQEYASTHSSGRSRGDWESTQTFGRECTVQHTLGDEDVDGGRLDVGGVAGVAAGVVDGGVGDGESG